MIADGSHEFVSGQYYAPSLGPWSNLLSAIGIEPYSLGPVFVGLGLLWIGSLFAALARPTWGWYAALIIAIATLWYLPVGTLFSIVYIVLLFKYRAQLKLA